MGDGKANLAPPYERGNAAARRHGAYREMEVGPLAEALVLEMAEQAPWAARPAFDGEVLACARAQAEAELLWRHVVEVGPVVDGLPNPCLEALHRAETRASKLRANLGMNPRAWATLIKELATSSGDADTYEALVAEGLRMQEAVEAAAREREAP